MKKILLPKYIVTIVKDYIFIFLTATILLSTSTKSLTEENIFTVSNIEIDGDLNLNFSREKYLNKAFYDSFTILMNKFILRKDLNKISNIKLEGIKDLISSFQIIEESYKKNRYKAKVKINFNEFKVKKFLGEKNISFSQPENISVLFYPVLFIDDEIQNFNENFFYKNWKTVSIKNETINYLLPLEDLEDISQIIKMKDKIEKLNIDNMVNKYGTQNYVFALMNYQSNKLNIHFKINFNEGKTSKNIFYEIKNFDDQLLLKSIIRDFKLIITDLWKEENLVNLLMPLSINLTFQHKDLKHLDDLRNTFSKISIINNYSLVEFNINNSLFKIYYYGNPKKLKSELLRYGYRLDNNQGLWQLYLK